MPQWILRSQSPSADLHIELGDMTYKIPNLASSHYIVITR